MYCVYKISIKANIQVVNREKDPVHQICMQEPYCQVPSVAGHGLSYWLWYHSILVAYSCWSDRSYTLFCLCVNWHPRLRIDTNYTCIKGETNRIMALPPASQNLFMHILRAIMLLISWKQQTSKGCFHLICVCSAGIWRVESLHLLSPMHQQDPIHPLMS